MELSSTRWFTRRRLLLVGAAALVIWLLFFDSHSVWKRVAWHHELSELREENAALRHRIDELETRLDEEPTDEEIEQLAREKYGMRRPDETVYRVQRVE